MAADCPAKQPSLVLVDKEYYKLSHVLGQPRGIPTLCPKWTDLCGGKNKHHPKYVSSALQMGPTKLIINSDS